MSKEDTEEDRPPIFCHCYNRHVEPHKDQFYVWWGNQPNGPSYLDSVKFLQEIQATKQ